MAVHVAEAADVHENVEAELLAGGKRPQQFVVLAAVAQAEVDDLAAARFARCLDRLANLPVRVVALAIEQGRSEFDFERIGVQQIDQRRRLNRRASASTRRQPAGVRGESRSHRDSGRRT